MFSRKAAKCKNLFDASVERETKMKIIAEMPFHLLWTGNNFKF